MLHRPARTALSCALGLTVLAAPAHATGSSRQVELFSQSLALHVAAPSGQPLKAVVVVTSTGDGWRGLARTVAEHLTSDGYAVLGLDARTYLLEATRLSGGLAPAAVPEDYLAILRSAHEWFPGAQRFFLIGISEGAGLSLVAAADPRVSAQLTGVVGVETPTGVSLRTPYWNWTSWITHKDADQMTVDSVDYLAAVAPTPVSFIHATDDPAAPLDAVQAVFANGGEPRRLDQIASERPAFDDAPRAFFSALRGCLEWSTRRSPDTMPNQPEGPWFSGRPGRSRR
ncbi:MAG TPA: AcvB/VirJ family lysyl-phosphatidylglycerol hydrolase [Vicinamibacterales bacterium]|nr:AcvB/VirJ family lysyl-phosphatidylglycerol hydrolase [Vicinamibacterales bacterium]